jgi:hypothetical protein
MSAVGGYFGLELKAGNEYHTDAFRLNTGRNSLEYILAANNYTKIYLPYYTCDVLLQPIKKLGLKYEFYFIDKSLEPITDYKNINDHETFLYTNYFGLKDQYITELKGQCKNLIIDNAQAFYSKPMADTDTFYSPRKFFGLPDGAYLYTNRKLERTFDRDVSFSRFDHLLKRIDLGAENGYPYFTRNENALDDLPILEMSKLTQRLLQSIDYSEIAERRRTNFVYLHNGLEALNGIRFELTAGQVPMVYPFLTEDANLRKRLISKEIYIPQYWPNVADWTDDKTIEFQYAHKLVHLPIDQRLGLSDLDNIIELVRHGRSN